MSILGKLESGELHAKARATRPDCVDNLGNIHSTPERAEFVSWYNENGVGDGMEYSRRYVAR